jgi:nitrogen fixation NifU-like protein
MALTHEEIDNLSIDGLRQILSNTAFEHAIHPRNRGSLEEADAHGLVAGPCGDTIEMWMKSRNGIVTDATFDTGGCRPSIAAASMATELARGKSLAEAASISQQTILRALGGFPEEAQHCALLATDTLKETLQQLIS